MIYGAERNITDADEVAKTVTDLFGTTFSQKESSMKQDTRLGDSAETNDEAGFMNLAEDLKIPLHIATRVYEGMQAKGLHTTGLEESEGLATYTPTLQEFKNYIDCLNPRSAGGPSGMTYLLAQYWPDNVKERVYESIKGDWIARKPFKSWGVRILQVIPKNSDPKLSELRPLMLVEVMRKIWVGLIMRKIAAFWEKWKLVDQSQHAYLRGKGTHTVLPQLLNCLEGARDFTTSIFLSSWDMKKAFDSVGRKFLLWCLIRLRIPKELASYMIGLDIGGKVFVKCPRNQEIAERGLAALDKEGYSFQTQKGIGQGDMPSPLFWVAVLDTLLSTLRSMPSGFRVQDMNGNTYPADDMAYADDLQSSEASSKALQDKADIVSAWCIFTGINISYDKLRTYGVHWGIHRGENPPLTIHIDNWEKMEVEMKMDGTMKSLGVLFDMHVDNQVQLRECIKTIEDKGEKILQADARKRDKMLAVGYNLLTNVVYRSQHSPWHLEEYELLDKSYVGLVRKVSKLIKGFPSKLITVDRKDGGLGVTTITLASMERKRKNMLDLVHRRGSMGIAMEGQISRMMREAGQGGLGPCRRHLWTALGELATGLSSLVRWLKTIGLRVRVGWGEMNGWELACNQEQDTTAREEMNARGMVLKSELGEGGEIPIRVGQCWEVDGTPMEILGFRGTDIEIMTWVCQGNIEVGKSMVVLDHSRPKGIGGDILIDKSKLMGKATHLLELGRDEITNGGEGELECKIIARRMNKPKDREVKTPPIMLREWAMWGGGNFTHIYTDGSFRKDENWGELLLGKSRVTAGGAIILSDGRSWFHRIYVDIDITVEDAGQVELICLLIANEMARAQGSPSILVSDCATALDVMRGTYSERFYNILAGLNMGRFHAKENKRTPRKIQEVDRLGQ